MVLEFLHTSCDGGQLVVTEDGGREVFRGSVDGREVFVVPEHLNGVTPVLTRDSEGTYLVAADVNGLSFWTIPDGGVEFLFVEHPHDPVSVRRADGTVSWFSLDDGQPTDRRAWVRDGCCCM